jgi:hypothetical protein
MKNVKLTPEQIAEEITKSRFQPFDAFGKYWQGDVFYSWIQDRTVKRPYEVFSKVCDILRDKGYYVHS